MSYKILIGATGSVASIKLIELIETIHHYETQANISIEFKVVLTEHAKHFVNKTAILEHFDRKDISLNLDIYDDADEWSSWKKISDPVLHIELRKWADVFLVAPLDANTMAKMSTGICDNLLTCIVRAWDLKKPLIFCPAMNCLMYEHPITESQIKTLKEMGYICIDSIEKKLACGDFGIGAMAAVNTIAERVWELLSSR